MKTRSIIALIVLLIVAGVIAVVVNRSSIPDHNTAATHFDTLIVLGTPANRDGTASPDQRARVLEAVREYKAGLAPHIIMTGGSAHNQFVEAHVMTNVATKAGVPATAILEEPQAQNTIQNIYYSSQVMHQHNWTSAEVISSPAHIGRAALILQAMAKAHPELAIEWRTHAAPWPKRSSILRRAFQLSLEASRCLELRIFGFPHSIFLPAR